MSGDGAFQYVPLDKLKIYQNNILFNRILRRLNFSSDFTLSEVPGTDSVDIGIMAEIQRLTDLSDVGISNPLVKQTIRYNGSGQWVNSQLGLDDLSDVEITPATLQAGHSLRYDATSSKYVNAFPFLDDLVDVVSSNPQAKQVIRHNGVNWLNALLAASDLSDVSITNPQTGETLRYDGTAGNFVNVAASALNILLNDLADVIITSATTNQFIGFNGSSWVNALVALNTLSDVTIGTLANKQVIQYNDGTGQWENILAVLNILSDVSITNPQTDDVLVYNGSTWVNGPGGGGGGATTLDDLTDVVITSASQGSILNHSGSTWVDRLFLEMNTISAPSDPGAGFVRIYSKAIDGNNYGLFIKELVGGVVEEVRIT